MHKVRVALYEGRERMSMLIKWQTRSRYSHAGLILPDGSVVESLSKAGVIHNKTPDLSAATIYSINGLSKEASELVVSSALRYVGCRYDYLAIFRFLSRRRMTNNNVWFCSELVYEAFRQSGVFLLAPWVESWRVSPGMLALSPMLEEDHGEWATELKSRVYDPSEKSFPEPLYA